MEITEKIMQYRKTGSSQLFTEIKNELLTTAYNITPKYFKLQKEDAGEFIIELSDEMDMLIANFKPDYGMFMNYFYVYLRNKVRFLYHRKNRSYHREQSVMERHVFYEDSLKTYNPTDNFFSPESSKHFPASTKKKILYAFSRNENIHKRFFLLAITVLPFMSMDIIAGNCRTFRFDTEQTVMICNRLSRICADQIEETKKLEERRNYYWNREIYLSDKLETEMYNNDYGSIDRTISLLETNRIRHEQKCEELENRIHRVPYSVLSEEFNISLKSLNSAICNIRFFISDIINCKTTEEIRKQTSRKGKNIQILKEIAAGRWNSLSLSSLNLSPLKPLEAFDVPFTDRY